jgi:hypothetical protein
VHSLQEIIRTRAFHPSVELRLQRAQEGAENGPETAACRAEADYREAFRAAVLKTMDAEKLDAFVYPTWSNPPRLIGDLNTPHGDNSQFSTTGFPAIQSDGLPRNITPRRHHVSERRGMRSALIAGLPYEQATHHRRLPASHRHRTALRREIESVDRDFGIASPRHSFSKRALENIYWSCQARYRRVAGFEPLAISFIYSPRCS